jgi:hypothetical protein
MVLAEPQDPFDLLDLLDLDNRCGRGKPRDLLDPLD